eukprot:15451396-Alexandrium_andersonii.AAC.1
MQRSQFCASTAHARRRARGVWGSGHALCVIELRHRAATASRSARSHALWRCSVPADAGYPCGSSGASCMSAEADLRPT